MPSIWDHQAVNSCADTTCPVRYSTWGRTILVSYGCVSRPLQDWRRTDYGQLWIYVPSVTSQKCTLKSLKCTLKSLKCTLKSLKCHSIHSGAVLRVKGQECKDVKDQMHPNILQMYPNFPEMYPCILMVLMCVIFIPMSSYFIWG